MAITQAEVAITTFPNGLTLLVEPIAGVASAGFSIAVPGGSVFDRPEAAGTAAVLTDMLTRGAGLYDSRALAGKLDDLGVQRHETTGAVHLGLGGATVAENLLPALRLYRDMLRDPHLPEAELDAARAGVEQDVRAANDDPRNRVLAELRRRSYANPWGRPNDGSLEGLAAVTHDGIRTHYATNLAAGDTVIGIAGAVDPDAVAAEVGTMFASWETGPTPAVAEGDRPGPTAHLTEDLAQTHIALSYPEVPYGDDAYYAAWATSDLLGGGMSSRLFANVREKHGLCYAISASLTGFKHVGRMTLYAGTTPERAQETLDRTVAELRRLGDGVEPDELARVKARAKSALVMQQESTSSRAGSLTRDWYHLGRVTPLEEVAAKIDALTPEDVVAHVAAHPPTELAVVTLGREPLELP